MADMAATSSTSSVDLSRLPAPSIVAQIPYEVIRAEMLADLQSRGDFDAVVESDPAVKVLEVAAYRELLIRQQAQDGALQLLLAYAKGAFLDHLAALVGVSRLEVSPANPATGTAAQWEDDDALRQRVVLAPEGFSVAGPELAYVFHAKSASPNVLDASAISPAPGEVLVSVLSSQGNGEASPELLAQVAAIVTDPAIRPLGDFVSVASAQLVPFAIVAGLSTRIGPDRDLVLANARERLDAYLASSRKLGRDITRAGIIGALMAEGVQNIALASPPEDIVCDLAQAGLCTGIALSFAGYGE